MSAVITYPINLSLDVDNLINSNSDLNKQNEYGDTLLHIICQMPSQDSLLFLQKMLSSGANINMINNNGYTPLMCLAKRCHLNDSIEMIKLLANAPDVNLNVQHRLTGFTALAIASHAIYQNNTQNVVQILLDAGADPNVPDVTGKMYNNV